MPLRVYFTLTSLPDVKWSFSVLVVSAGGCVPCSLISDMSNPLNWPAIGLWSAAASFQLGTAIRDAWNSRRQRRPSTPPTGYNRVVNGERVNGWKTVISASTIKQHFGDWGWWSFVCPTWTNGGDLTDFSRFSVVLCFGRRSPDGREIQWLNRCSLLTPNANASIMKVISDTNQWESIGTYYLSDRVLVSVYSSIQGSVFRLILADVVVGSHRVVTIEAPVRDNVNRRPGFLMPTLCTFPKPLLNVHFYAQHSDPLEDDPDEMVVVREFVHASYDISVSGSIDTPIKAISWQSVVIPFEWRPQMWGSWFAGYPPVVHLYTDATDTENVTSIVFGEGSWRMEKFNDWLSSFRATSDGAKWMNAVESFGALSPPDWDECPIPPLRFTPRISGPTCDDAVLCFTGDKGILERSLSPHSLKRLAAEALCKAFPNFDFAELEKMIGFDVFDGIYHPGETMMIYL